MNTYSISRPLASSIAALLAAASAHAAPFVWDGTNNTWTSPHWNAGVGGPTGASNADSADINGGTVTFAGHDHFGNDATTASPVISINSGGTLVSGGSFNTIWDLTLNGGTLLANGGANSSYPAFQLVGTVTVGGSQVSTIAATTAVNANNQINIGGNGNTTLGFNVANATGDANPDLIINATLQNSNFGAGSFTKSGAGTLLLTGVNTYSGATSVNDGVLAFAGSGTLAAGAAISVASGAILAFARHDTFGNHATAVTQTITVNGGTITNVNNAFTTLGAVTLNGGTINSTGGAVASFPSFSLRGPVAVGGSAASTISGSGANSQMVVGVNTAGSQTTFDVANATGDSAADLIISVPLQNNRDGAQVEIATGILKTGVGTIALTGANTYTGNTTVNAGNLLVNGTISGSATVNNGGTLGGSGTLGAVTVASGGTLAPGASTGLLTTTGNVTFASGATLSMEINCTTAGTGYDRLIVGGDVALGDATLSLTVGFVPTSEVDIFTLIENNGANPVSGTFSGLANGGIITIGAQDYQISYFDDASTFGFELFGGNDVSLFAVPEPASVLTLLGGLGVLATLRRRRS